MGHEDKAQVAKRRVFYIPGYDPYPPRRYRELYRTESAKQASISGYDVQQTASERPSGWRVEADIDGAHTETEFNVLVWNDLVQTSMKPGILGTYCVLAQTAWIYLSTGALWRLSWLAKGPILAALYPVVMLIAQLGVAVVLGSFLGRVGTLALDGAFGRASVSRGIDVLVFSSLALIVMGMTLRWFRSQDDKTFAYYLMHDYAYTASRRGAYPPEIEERLATFKAQVEADLRDGVDEILVIGHSSGAQLAVSLVSDIVRSGRCEGPALSLLTLGQVIPMVSFLPKADRLRGDLRLLSVTQDVTWLDVSAPGDGCCFALSDPVAVSGVAPETGQLWPVVISAAFSNTLAPETLSRLKRRYFRLHFQYLCAFDRPSDYDYFRVTAGPQTLEARFKGRVSSKNRIDFPASRFTSFAPAPQ
ncbi:MAG: hypothetical protein AAF222_10720 [Pseudomonadota bacterium]